MKGMTMRGTPVMVIMGCLLALAGCSVVAETGKTLWGSSTRALEKARVDAITKTYHCSFDDCFSAVVDMGKKAEPPVYTREYEAYRESLSKGEEEKKFKVFLKDPIKGVVVLMEVPGSVDTTEVGVFFKELAHGTIKIEVSSLSSSAKRKVSEMIFKELSLRFNEMQ